jgi:hypothetical protein
MLCLSGATKRRKARGLWQDRPRNRERERAGSFAQIPGYPIILDSNGFWGLN